MATREETAQQRRDQIIEAALDLFTEKGYHGGSIREIAKRVGITEGLIYHYFKDKEDVYKAIIDKMMGIRDEVLSYIRIDLPLEDNIRKMAQQITTQMGSNPLWIKFIKLMVVVAPTQKNKQKQMIAGRIEQGMLMLGSIIDLKKESGEIGDVDGYLSARMFVGGLIAFFILQYVMGIDDIHKVKVEDYLDNSLKIFIKGIGAD
jgi:AcrR family transcriptional regulator